MLHSIIWVPAQGNNISFWNCSSFKWDTGCIFTYPQIISVFHFFLDNFSFLFGIRQRLCFMLHSSSENGWFVFIIRERLFINFHQTTVVFLSPEITAFSHYSYSYRDHVGFLVQSREGLISITLETTVPLISLQTMAYFIYY